MAHDPIQLPTDGGGTCLARGAAIAMGRAHVDAGGAVTDLRY